MHMYAQARGSRWVSGDGGDDDPGADDLQTVMWTRALAGLDRHNVEGCEDLLDTYFTQASTRPHYCGIRWVLPCSGGRSGTCACSACALYVLTLIDKTPLQGSVGMLD